MDWGETKVFINEVEQLFSRDDDIKDINHIKKMAGEIDLYYQNTLKDAKEVIRDMITKVSVKETEISAPTESEHSNAIQSYIYEKSNISDEINKATEEIERAREHTVQLSTASQHMKEKSASYEAECRMQDSRTAYAVSLYSKITNISWDYTTNPGILAGVICHDTLKEVKPFSIDTRVLNSGQVANTLWDLIGSAYPEHY